MNGKKAKQLRKKAREYSIGMPEVEYNLTRKHLVTYPGLPNPVMCGTVELKDTCTRALYKKLKRGM
jgi:hypothetical protein